MTEEIKESVFKEVDLNCLSNNTEHHTNEISKDQLIVRRGQSFNLTLKLTEPFTPELHPLSISAITGRHPSEDLGTASFFGIPDHVERSPSAKAVWKVELVWSSLPMLGILNLKVTPPADAPIGEYILSVKYRGEETLLAMLVMLFNPWCPDDSVFLLEEPKRQEYVMNEEGIIYQGSGKYIIPLRWDFGQFDSSMVDICMKILDLNPKHLKDPADDVSARCNPIYVSRVISAMVNSEDDRGVVEGRWEGSYRAGFEPSHWSGSLAILKMWLKRDCHPVKYGQCWVYAGVMVSVMRFLGIPCRPITNYQSAHDCNANLIIDEYYADYGVREKPTHDSIWNYHVWVEGWMKRPDLSETGKYDGWQVLDPTPQEKSDGVYCCGPASVEAIRSGRTDLKYDVPFVFAEVNADCVDWLVKADGSLVRMWTDTKTVGQNISTKAVGSDKRQNVTRSYKQEEGTKKEREIYEYARTRDYKREDEEKDEDLEPEDEAMEEDKETPDHIPAAEEDKETPDHIPTVEEDKETALDNVPRPQVFLEFNEVTRPQKGQDVSLRLKVSSKYTIYTIATPLSINISVQAMRHNGVPAANIQREVKVETLEPGKELSIPVVVPFLKYYKPMLECESMKVSAVVIDKLNPDNTYLAEDDVVLFDPPISITVAGPVRVNREAVGEVIFLNPVNLTLKDCTLSFTGSAIWKEEAEFKMPDMKPNTRIVSRFTFVPHKAGKKTLTIDFDCSVFRNIKSWCTIDVEP